MIFFSHCIKARGQLDSFHSGRSMSFLFLEHHHPSIVNIEIGPKRKKKRECVYVSVLVAFWLKQRRIHIQNIDYMQIVNIPMTYTYRCIYTISIKLFSFPEWVQKVANSIFIIIIIIITYSYYRIVVYQV
jgi:hypothetical protein